MRRHILAFALAAGFASLGFAANTDTGSTTLSIAVGPEAKVTSVTATSTFGVSTTKFEARTATTDITYKIRTTESGGSGSITVLLTDFSGGGAVPPLLADLTYGCTKTGGSETVCAASGVTVSNSEASNVATFGANYHSDDSGSDKVTLAWTLVDRPAFATGTYTATATFTISAA